VPTAASLDPDTGLIAFGGAPAAGKPITASFEFDVPVRFDNDDLELVALNLDLEQPINVVLVEVRERAA
jgi:uncharacterized protein (TIGR02217 family)